MKEFFRVAYGVLLILILSTGIASAQTYTESITAGSGTLNYTVLYEPGPQHSCTGDGGYSYINKSFYSGFSYTAAGVTTSLGTQQASALQQSVCATGVKETDTPVTLLGAGLMITFTPSMPTGGTAVVASGTQGYLNPKFLVVGVTYAPPGPSSYVQYQKTSFFGVTNSIASSFQQSNTNSVSVTSSGGLPLVANGKVTDTYSTTSSQTSMNSQTVTASISTQTGEKTSGTSNAFAPINNDYDTIWVWLNPAIIVTIYPGDPVPVWNGYGIDSADQNGMDIVGIQLGYLNGHFGSIPPDISTSFSRSWSTRQVYPSGQVAALTASDYALIAAADPFSVSTYGTNYIGYAPPSSDTADGRFSLSTCSTEASFPYVQAAPSQAPGVYTCNLTYINLDTTAQGNTTSNSQTFSTDVSFSGSGFLATLSADLKVSNTLTITTSAQSSITSSTTTAESLSVQGPACGNSIAGMGPCNPVYDSSGNQPTQFDVYQDNRYGTFMFAPIHYY